MAVHGIDVSEHQGKIDWAKVKKSGKVNFAIIRAGGSSPSLGYYDDDYFEINYKNAKAQGIPVGAYYYVGSNCTTTAEGITCAEKFLGYLKGKTFEYPVYIDCEATPYSKKKGATDAAIAFIQKVQNAGYWVGVYGSTLSTFEYRLDDSRLQAYAHWIAQYASSCDYGGKVGIGIWQYTSSGKVDGISRNVDMNYCYVDYPTKIKAKGLNGFKKTTAPTVTKTTTKTVVTESSVRTKAVSLADSYIGCVRGDSRHKKIIDTFNTVQPDGWPMNYTAAWCATFVSAIAILQFGKDKAKKYFPLSANCRGIIDGAKERGIWIENDAYVPSPGDWIIYDWEDSGIGDTKGYDHVGIVKEVKNGNIIVIEGNKNNKCAYRNQAVDGLHTSGFVHPNYAEAGGVTATTTVKKQTATSTTKKVSIKVDGDWGKQTTGGLRTKLGISNSKEKKEADHIIKNQLNSCKKYLIAVNSTGWKFAANPKDSSPTIEALQKKIGVTADGYMGYNSVVMLQQFLNRQINAGLEIDGYMGKKTVKALQTWINK